MDKENKISVIMPAYNSEKHIAEAIDSVISLSEGKHTKLRLTKDGQTFFLQSGTLHCPPPAHSPPVQSTDCPWNRSCCPQSPSVQMSSAPLFLQGCPASSPRQTGKHPPGLHQSPAIFSTSLPLLL